MVRGFNRVDKQAKSSYNETIRSGFSYHKGVVLIDHLSRISASGATLKEAQERLIKLVPEGSVLVLSYYRSEFGLNALKESGESDEIAIRKVETRLPRNAKIISKKLVVKATTRSIQVQVNGALKEALDEAKFLISPPEVVRSGKLVSPATNGVFGIGAKKAVYTVTVGVNAVAEAVYETPVDLTGCVGAAQLKILIDAMKAWYKSSASQNSFLYLPDKLCQACGKPLKANPFLTPKRVLCENCTNLMLGTTNWESALKHLNLDFGPGVPSDIVAYAETLTPQK